MACIDGLDPSDFQTGVLDPSSDPTPPASSFDISDGTYFDVSSPYIEFDVTQSPVDYDTANTVLWSTVAGTAVAGTHYTAVTNQSLNFSAGEGSKKIQVSVLTPAGITGSRTLSVTLSGNSAGTVIGDGTGAGTIYYAGSAPPPGGGDAGSPSYTGWPSQYATIYDQFRSCSTADCPVRCGGCNYYGACQAFAGAAVASCHRYRLVGDKQCYDAKTLYNEAGGPGANSSCQGGGYYDVVILAYLAGQTNSHYGGSGLGAKLNGTSTRRKINSWNQISDATKAGLIVKIKKSIAANGCVYMSSIFYSNWNSSGSSHWPNYVLPDNGSSTSSGGHSWLLVGWNDSISGGSFLIQSSHGTGWANSGRAWIPYSYLKLAGTSPNPWYRYYAVVPKAGG